MYIHIGDEMVISTEELVGILHLPSKKPRGKKTLEIPGQERKWESVHSNIKSCVITVNGIFYSSISATTLKRRIARNLV